MLFWASRTESTKLCVVYTQGQGVLVMRKLSLEKNRIMLPLNPENFPTIQKSASIGGVGGGSPLSGNFGSDESNLSPDVAFLEGRCLNNL